MIEQALDDLQTYLAGNAREAAETRAMLHPASGLSHRQTALLGHAVRNPGAGYTIASHRNSHAVACTTARADLLALAEAGLLDAGKRGRAAMFTAPPDLSARLRAFSG